MTRTARGALIGGAVGALVAIAQTVRAEDDPQHVVAVQALRGAAQGALVGSLVGWVADAVEAARPVVEQAAEAVEHAVDVTLPRVEQVVEAALPVVEQAAEVVRRRAA
jgi:hypothetical protein